MTKLFGILLVALLSSGLSGFGQQPARGRFYNTVKDKLAQGRQVVAGTISIPDPELYCAVANAGFDLTWIEMQHSPLTYQDVARMVAACKGAPAIPFIRVPDASEGDIQKAVDLGALGIIIPMVDTVEKAQAAVRFTKYPPLGRRSQGGGQYGTLYGSDYRQTANDNIMIVALIENPAGVDIADQIAAVPGIDIVFVASTDLGSFSGFKQGEPQYEALVTRTEESVRKANRYLGGPLAWRTRKGYQFFQGPGETALVSCAARLVLGLQPTGCPTGPVAKIEGAVP
ncbi:MAG TPA: aldolase/citrate lyase family protein [Vicinamibacterales bacterium]|nr:aldolase/citrate lyase family protein [Vicinamibacterales bacterium]